MTLTAYSDPETWALAREGQPGEYPISGTDVAKVLGRSPFGSPWDVYAARRLGIRPEHDAATLAAFARGHRQEPRVLEDYAAETGREVTRTPHAIARHPTIAWAIASPDATSGADGIVEAKTSLHPSGWGSSETTIERWVPGSELIVPPVYALQVYWQLECMGRAWCDIAVSIPRSYDWPELRWYRLLRDERTQAALVRKVGAWRQRHLVEGIPPKVDASDACRSGLLALHPEGDGKRQATPEEVEVCVELHRVKAAKAALERDEALLTNRVAEAVGDASGLVLGVGKGAPTMTWVRVAGRPSVGVKAILAERPDLAPLVEKHTKIGAPSAFPRFNRMEG